MSRINEQAKKDLNKALNIAISSLTGFIIPVLGLVLALVAIIISTNVKNQSDYTKSRKKIITYVVVIGVISSLMSSVVYYSIYTGASKRDEKQKISSCNSEVQAIKDKIYAANAKYVDTSNILRNMWNTDTKNCSAGIDVAINNAKQLYSNALNDGKLRCNDYANKRYRDGFLQESRSLGRTDGKLPYANIGVWDARLAQWKNDCTLEFTDKL